MRRAGACSLAWTRECSGSEPANELCLGHLLPSQIIGVGNRPLLRVATSSLNTSCSADRGEPDRATECFIRLKDVHRLIGWQIYAV